MTRTLAERVARELPRINGGDNDIRGLWLFENEDALLAIVAAYLEQDGVVKALQKDTALQLEEIERLRSQLFISADLQLEYRRKSALSQPQDARLTQSELRQGEENDGPLESTDLFLEWRGISLLVNVPAGSRATYSMHVDNQHQSTGSIT